MTTQNQLGSTTSYGRIWMNTGSWTGVSKTIASGGTEMGSLSTSFTLMTPSKDFSMSTDGRLKYTGAKNKNFLASAYLSENTNTQIAIFIYKNGSPITGVSSNTGSGNFLLANKIPIALVTNDYLSVFCEISGGNTVTITQISLSARSLF